MYDILIDRVTTEGEHDTFVEKVLQQCAKHWLAVNLSKSQLHVHVSIFPGQIDNGSQVPMDPARLKSMAKWPVPTKEKEVQAFSGIADYYHRFVEYFGAKVGHLINLPIHVPFSWLHQRQEV